MDAIKQNVILVSQTFYNTQDKEQRRVAEDWLNDFKRSIDAWTVADQLLHTDRSEQVLFFAAQTIRSKIQYSFHELPIDFHQSLRNSLVEHLENLSKLNFSSVQTQIYIALADMIMQMPTWDNPVVDIIQRLSKPPDRIPSLIEFLAVLPEEINNKRLKLGQNRRDNLRDLFAKSAVYTVNFLEENLINSMNDPAQAELRLKIIYKCFSSWIDERLVEPTTILNSNLFVNIFQILSNPNTGMDLHEAVTNCLVNILLLYPFNARVNEAHKELLIAIKQNICALPLAYKNAEAQSLNQKCYDLSLIFTELCNALSYFLINENHTALGELSVMNLLLLCGTHDDYEVFQKTFVFWFSISEEIYTSAKSDKLCSLFRDYIYSLIECLCKHTQLDPNHQSTPPGKSDDFGEFRQKVTDLVSDVVFIVESNKCFEKMYTILQAPNAQWFEIEAALYIICAFARSVSQDEDQSVSHVLQAILALPEQVHVAVKSTSIRLIGELAEWLNKHSQFIESSLNFVCTGFGNPELSQVAANAMLNVCTQCQQHMVNHLETLINIVLSTDNIEMPGDASMELLKGVVVILCNLPSEEITSPLMRLCRVQVEGLQKAVSGQIPNGTRSLPIFWLDRLTAIFRTIKIRPVTNGAIHPCKPVVESVWPILSVCLNKYSNDFKVTESCCRALRFVLRCAEKHSQLILIDVVNVIVEMYRRKHFSCFLYLGSILVDIYGAQDDFKTGLVEMMQVFTNEAFEFIIASCSSVDNLNELRKHPDTIDDFFRLSHRFLLRCPTEFIESPIFQPVMHLAVTSLNIDHREANQSVTKFLSEFISLSHKPQIQNRAGESNKSIVMRIINEIGSRLLENAINATINMTTRDTKDGIADVIMELMSVNRRQVEMDLLNVLKNLRKTNQNGSEIVTENQLVELHKKIIESDTTSDVENALIQLEQFYL